MKIRETKVAGAILAGGKNSRMGGKNKSFIDIGGITIIQRTLGLLEEIFEEIILVTNSPQAYKQYAKKLIIKEDIIKNAGPLGGIHAALSTTSKDGVFFVACDMPFLHNDLIHRQLCRFKKKKCDCLVPIIENLIEPLHAVYRTKLKDDICDFLKNGYSRSIRDFLKTVDTDYLDVASSPMCRRIFKNLNTTQDLKRLEKPLWR